MRVFPLLVALLILASVPAFATGSLSCSFADRNVKLEAEAAFSHGVGEGFMNFGGTLEVLAKAAPEDLRKLDLTLEHLTQRWLYGKELKLRIYHERTGNAPHGYVELIVQTRQHGREETDYRGSYVLNVYHLPDGSSSEGKTLTLRGKAACSVG
jgi:hypothetical protein